MTKDVVKSEPDKQSFANVSSAQYESGTLNEQDANLVAGIYNKLCDSRWDE